jgi:Arc/MetJ-type ribon-helix-helix transcriptional regulator
MATVTIELTDRMMKFVDGKVQSGSFKDANEAVQALLDVAIRVESRAEIDKKLLEALDQIERGECAPWNPAEDRKMLQEMIRERFLDAEK